MIKKTGAILLLTILVTVSLNHTFFNFYRLKIKHEIKELIEKHLIKDYQTVKVEASAKLKWITKGKEFIKDGVFYDVISIKNINGKKTYICITDTKETKLVSNFVKSNKPLTNAITSAAKLFIKYLPVFAGTQENPTVIKLNFTEAVNTYTFLYVSSLTKPPKY